MNDQVIDLATYSRVLKCNTVCELQSLMQELSLSIHAMREDGLSLLHTFALIGLYDICKYLCTNGARPTIIPIDKSTVFHCAVKAKNASEDEERANILKLFLDKDDIEVDLNQRNTAGWTAIKLAARRSLEKCVELLLSSGADPNIPDNEQFTSLHNAVTNVDILKLLLTRCSNVNVQNNKEETPLYCAVEKGSCECVMSLLEYNADPNIPDKEGVTPLFLATKDGNIKLTEVLVKAGANVNACGAKQKISPLHWAAHKENDKMALFLIQNGADILLADNEGRTPISMASPALAEQMIAVAKSLNPEINIMSTNIETKLSAADKAVAACCGGNVQALTVLLESGISVDHISGDSQSTLLHMAAYCGQLPVVAYLLSLEANIMAVDKDDDNVLHFACMKEVSHGVHQKTLQLLLNTPAKSLINKPNNKGDTPIMVATRCCFPERVKILLKKKADSTIANKKKELPLHRACASSDNIESVMLFAELFPNVNMQDEDGWTPLMYAAKSGSAAVVLYLLQRGANPNIRQNSGFTAVYLAAQDGHTSSCWHLLEGKADPNIVGGLQGLAPLHIAAHHDAIELCKLLIEYGGDPCLKDNDGDTPLDLVTSPELKAYMQHVHQRSNKNREQGNPPANQSHQDDSDHVISNEETVSNENVSNDDVTNLVVSRHGDNVTDGSVTTVSSGNVDVVTISNSGVANNNDNVAVSNNNDVSADSSIILALKEQEYLETISNLKRTIEVLSIKEKRLLNDLAELKDKYKSLEDSNLQKTDSISNERDQYRIERDELQREVDNVAHVTSLSGHQQGANVSLSPTPNDDRWQPVDHNDIKLDSSKSGLFPHLITCSGMYHNMEVIVATLEYKQAGISTIIMSELAQLSAIRCSHLVQLLATAVDHEHHMIYLVYENIGSTNLSKLIHSHGNWTITWRERIHLLQDVTVGMSYLHSLDPFIGHYCLCPCIVQVYETTSRWRARIGHYGMVQTLSNNTSPKPVEIIPYLAPEVLQDCSYVKNSDVYSFGMLMYETVTEYVPYSDTGGSNVVVLMYKIISGAKLVFPQLTNKYQSHEQGIKEATSIINSCHSNSPEDRPSFNNLTSSLKLLL